MEMHYSQHFYGDITVNNGSVGIVQTGTHSLDVGTSQSRIGDLSTSSSRAGSSAPSLKRVPPPSQMFIGREDILEKMRRELCASGYTSQVVYVLHGLGGAGKTQIMSKFVQSCGFSFCHIYLIDSTSSTTILSSFRGLGYREAKLSGELNDKEIVERVHDWLDQLDGTWLIVFDNADDTSVDLGDYIPPCSRGRVIITTRNEGHRFYAQPAVCHTAVGELEQGEAIKLLHRLVPPDKRGVDNAQSISESIVEELGRLALAITHAGSYIAESTSLVFSSYLEILRAKRKGLLSRKRTRKRDGYNIAVYATWELSFERLTADPEDKYGIAASHIFQLCAFFHPKEISITIFSRAFRLSDRSGLAWDVLQHFADDQGEWDPESSHHIFNKLGSYSLVSAVTEGLYSIHSLVHKWTKDRLSDEARSLYERQALECLADSMTYLETTAEIDYRRSLLVHVLQHDISAMLSSETWVCNGISKIFQETGCWSQAETLHKAVLAREVGKLGSDHPVTMNSMANLAFTYWTQGRWDEAEELEVKVLRLRTEKFGPEHPDRLTSMASLASTYWNQGRWKEAEELEVKVMRLRTEKLGPDHLDTLKSMDNLASTYRNQGRWNDAEELEVEVLRLITVKLGPDHPGTLTSMANLASTYWSQERWSEAEELEVKVMHLRTEKLGSDHPDTLASMANLASTYQKQGRWSEAEELGVKAAQLTTEKLGPDHPDTLKSVNILASTYRNQGQLDKAEEMYLKVLQLRTEKLGSDHPSALTSMNNLALTYMDLKKWQDAEPLLVKAVERARQKLGENHPSTLLFTSGGGQHPMLNLDHQGDNGQSNPLTKYRAIYVDR